MKGNIRMGRREENLCKGRGDGGKGHMHGKGRVRRREKGERGRS